MHREPSQLLWSAPRGYRSKNIKHAQQRHLASSRGERPVPLLCLLSQTVAACVSCGRPHDVMGLYGIRNWWEGEMIKEWELWERCCLFSLKANSQSDCLDDIIFEWSNSESVDWPIGHCNWVLQRARHGISNFRKQSRDSETFSSVDLFCVCDTVHCSLVTWWASMGHWCTADRLVWYLGTNSS